jgi:hypothetical protein
LYRSESRSRLVQKEEIGPEIEPERRNARGDEPTRVVNNRVKYAGSSYPTRCAIAATQDQFLRGGTGRTSDSLA